MFQSLSANLEKAIKSLKGQGRITEINIAATIKEIRRSLVQADVHYKVAKQVTDAIKQKAIGTNVITSVSPGQLFTKLVQDALTDLMGGIHTEVRLTGHPAVILVAGLQGAGKTTLVGKLGYYYQKKNKNPLLVACDLYRPAAVDQLKTLGVQLNISVYTEPLERNPYTVAQNAIKEAKSKALDLVIVDTAGRLTTDEEMMQEICMLKERLTPSETLFVVDAMAGQDAVTTAQVFNEKLNFDGVVLTKLDGDARGGAALSIRSVVHKPIKFISTGEKMQDLDLFHPDRMASRILGMGDVISFVERAEAVYNETQQRSLQQKIKTNQFNLEDLDKQIQKIEKIGSIKEMVAMLPGLGKAVPALPLEDDLFKNCKVIIASMTVKERRNPHIIDQSRRERIARGSGKTIQEVNQLLKQFDMICKMMKKVHTKGSNLLGSWPSLLKKRGSL
ncbi:Signal recognition particle protein [Cardinium endosymbiont cEper1 of Encarsia pergandiella]|uniref:signal recognition particle protein n=1 Tax=Cardinium endosymbiont of Encarsia pergandiella TaxID=249402 RepID=UPI00027EAAD4|nr:signal recognition particle protein [Cardinium endosymbiont of Encarsia pergandiella]CCM09896.1 Signal recognition particle protein [Cardinium endosymbiont cEper1 of Encarsia pergandiella]